jgi:hypothetical protein
VGQRSASTLWTAANARPVASHLLRLAPGATLALGFWFAVAHGVAEDPRRTVGFLTLCCAVFAFLPAVMAAAMAVVATIPCLLLGPIALVTRLWTGRPTGFGDLAQGVFETALAVVPGYARALGKIRSPRVWGFVLGSYAALPALILTLGSAPG